MYLEGKRVDFRLLARELRTEGEYKKLLREARNVPISVFRSVSARVGIVDAADVELELSLRCEVVGLKVGNTDSGGWGVSGNGG